VKRLLLDANLLVLLVVGLHDPALVPAHRRTRTFSVEDYDALTRVLANYDQIVVTPNILTEASNLLGHGDDKLSIRLSSILSSLIDQADERYVTSAHACTVGEYPRLGLTDAGILESVSGDLPLLTADLGLYVAAASKVPNGSFNFNHMRHLG
jgi:hypothetical protein